MSTRPLGMPDRLLRLLLARGMGPGKNFAGSAAATGMRRGPPKR
jgi:hypothetical protein